MVNSKLESSNKIVIIGMASPKGIGDALQYGNAAILLNSLLPKASVTLMCPKLKDNLSVFQGVKFDAHLIDSSFVGFCSIIRLLGASVRSSKISLNDVPISPAISGTTARARALYNKLSRSLPPLIWPDKFASLYTLRHLKFDAGLLGGHTCTINLHDYLIKYNTMRSIVDGPIVTSPISISSLAIKEGISRFNRKLIMSKLGSSLQKFEFIYARGPYSLKILRDHFNLERVEMALDAGFGIRLIYPHSMRRKGKKRIIIIPRREYFDYYHRKDLYKLYLNAIATFISWAYENLDCEIFLSSQSINREAIDDLICVLHQKKASSSLKSLRIAIPHSIVETCKLLSSSDLVISSYLHGGITALALGVPTFFIMPFLDIKLLDVLSFLGLDTRSFAIDMFNTDSLKARNLIDNVQRIADNLKHYRNVVNSAVDKRILTLEDPIRNLVARLQI